MTKKIVVSFLVLVLLVPQVSFAAWWNPFTWNIFNRAPQVLKVEQPRKEADPKKKVVTQVTLPNKSSESVDSKNKGATKVIVPTNKLSVPATELSETKLLRKELEDLKKQISATGQPAKSTGSVDQLIPTQNLIDYYEIVIKSLSEDIEILPKDPHIEDSLNYLRDRRQSLVAMREWQSLKYSTDKFNPNNTSYYWVGALNKSIDEYVDSIDKEIRHIDILLGYIDSNMPILRDNLSYYQKELLSLSKNPNKLIPQEELAVKLEEANKVMLLKFDIRKNFNDGMLKYIDFVKRQIDYYQSKRNYITNVVLEIGKSIDKENEAYSLEQRQQTDALLSQPVPKFDFPKTTRCTVRGDGVGFEAYVDCYQSGF